MTIGNDLIVLKSRLSERKGRRKDNTKRADTLTRMIRDIVDPFSGDFMRWDMHQFRVLSADLIDLAVETKALDEEIAKLELELHG